MYHYLHISITKADISGLTALSSSDEEEGSSLFEPLVCIIVYMYLLPRQTSVVSQPYPPPMKKRGVLTVRTAGMYHYLHVSITKADISGLTALSSSDEEEGSSLFEPLVCIIIYMYLLPRQISVSHSLILLR